jgi:RHS repeat-associated protein
LLEDAESGQSKSLSHGLLSARAYHSATVLPDGRVLIFGGIGLDGHVVPLAELFDPATQAFSAITVALASRAYHSATLLTDGRLLVIGGISAEGVALETAELWDPRANRSERTGGSLHSPRQGHSATLMPDGVVVVTGGVNGTGTNVGFAERYDAQGQSFSIIGGMPAYTLGQPHLEASLPTNGAEDVPLDSLLSIRFSACLKPQSVSSATIKLIGPDGEVAATTVAAEGGLLAFITPKGHLLAATPYRIEVAGPVDGANQASLPEEISFTTEKPHDNTSTSSTSGGDAFDPSWRALPPLQALPGITAIAGQTLTLNGKPLKDVTFSIDKRKTRSDATGRFLLPNLAPGRHALLIDGRSASSKTQSYGVFEVGVEVLAGKTYVLPYTIWMTELDTAHAVKIPSPTNVETVITNPLLPGLELHIPANTVIRDSDGNVATQISITPVPISKPPFPLPSGIDVPIYFTIQPGAAYVQVLNKTGPQGARLIYPNTYHSPVGSRFDFWNYDADVRGWYVYGQGTVAQNGVSIVPDPGVVIYEFTGAMVAVPGIFQPNGPAPGGEIDGADPVDLGTGLFVVRKTDLVLPDVIPLAFTRTYRQGDSLSRPFGIGATHPYEEFIVGDRNPYTYIDLSLPDGGRVHYNRISSGTGWTDAVYQHTAAPTGFYGSIIAWNGNGWNLTLKNGTVYTFPDSAGLTNPAKAALIGIKDRYGNQLTFTRDATTGNLTKITTPNNRWIALTYDTSNRITQAADNIGRTVGYTYDSGGRLSTVTDANGGVTTYTYDSFNQMLTIQDPRNIVYLTNQYDSNGRVSQQTAVDSTTFQFAYTLDGTGHVTQTSVTDPRGKVETVTFNSAGYALTHVFASGLTEQQTFTYQRNSGNLVTSVTDPLANQTTYAYDTMGNVTSITRLAGTSNAVTTSMTYESTFNHLASITDPLSHTTSFSYDSKGNLTTVTDALGHQTTYSYNTAGQPVAVSDALGHTTQLSYDSGDLVGVNDPLSHGVTRFFDNAGRLLSITDSLARTTRYQYNALNQITAIIDPLGNTTAFSYDANGNLLSVTDANSHATAYTYNNMDRLATRTDPLTRAETYHYDADGNLDQFTDRKGQVTTYSYDGLNRRTFAGFGTVAGTPPTYASTIGYTYDAGNRLTQAVDSVSGMITRAYDGLNRLTSETTPQGTISYTYDNASRRSTMTVAGQSAVSYTYDTANRLTQIAQSSATVAFAYDNANRRTSVTLPNGVVQQYSYDMASRLASINYALSGSTLGALSYSYDDAGRRIQTSGSYARTGLPTALSSATYDAGNELTAWGSSSLTFDSNGNLTSDGSNSYSWDARNQLASIGSTSFVYDPFGRRAARGSTGFLYDGANTVQELSGTTPTANMLTGGVDELFRRIDAASTANVLIDALGSAVALSDTSGTTQTQYSYDPFGGTSSSGTSSVNPSQYTGRENDGDGLYYYRARYYSPALHRFLTEDPTGFPAGMDLYSYVHNSPLNLIDPLGLVDRGWGFGVVGGGDVIAGNGTASGDAATGSLGIGYFNCGNCGRPFGNESLGVFAAGGIANNSMFRSSGIPVQQNQAVIQGLYAGVGLGGFITNAGRACGLSGPFRTRTLATPLGSLQYAEDQHGTWYFGVTGGPGSVFGYSDITTSTAAGGVGLP